MAREVQMTPATETEDKIVGGILTFKQFIWLIAGVMLGLGMFVTFYLLTGSKAMSLIFGFIGSFSGTPFAFYKKHDLPLMTYLIYKHKFNKKSKILINRRNER